MTKKNYEVMTAHDGITITKVNHEFTETIDGMSHGVCYVYFSRFNDAKDFAIETLNKKIISHQLHLVRAKKELSRIKELKASGIK